MGRCTGRCESVDSFDDAAMAWQTIADVNSGQLGPGIQPSFFPLARYMRTWAFSTVTMPSVMA
jgi:hypothetical protein